MFANVPDPSWKVNPDMTADATFEERYTDDGYSLFDDDLAEEEIGEELGEEPADKNALIAITRFPMIRENLHALRDRWEEKAREACELVCTDDSIQSVKKMRAEMRKEFDAADEQRKAVKEVYMRAWTEVEDAWKECVAEPFGRADNAYKTIISEFEKALKDACKGELGLYFSEVCQVEGVDYLTLDQAMGLAGVKITMADANAKTPKRLMEAIRKAVEDVALGAKQIAEMEDAAEIMTEYKDTFDVGTALSIVNGRRRKIKAEEEAAEARRIEQERLKLAEDKVEAVAPPVAVDQPKPAEKVYREFSFTVFNCTKSQLLKIRDFLKMEGITYE